MKKINILTSSYRRSMEINECGEKLVDMRVKCPSVAFEIADYLNPDGNHKAEIDDACFVRETIAGMINSVQESLPNGLRLVICCGYRTPAVQARQYKVEYENLRLENPDWDKEKLDYEIEKRIDPPDVGPHCTGGAIDLSIVDKRGRELDMGTRVDEFNHGTYTYSDAITSKSKTNRQILIDAMKNAGFLNFPTEWWHWSYGDREWAHANGQTAFYGSIEQRPEKRVGRFNPNRIFSSISAVFD